jgi:hypothetical protein
MRTPREIAGAVMADPTHTRELHELAEAFLGLLDDRHAGDVFAFDRMNRMETRLTALEKQVNTPAPTPVMSDSAPFMEGQLVYESPAPPTLTTTKRKKFTVKTNKCGYDYDEVSGAAVFWWEE